MEEKARLLIVDDETINVTALRGALGSEYIIQIAKNSLQALKIAKETYPALILLDIIMPQMDGYTVCKELKSKEDTRQIPIIFITSKSEYEDEVNGLKLGAVDYITKPFNPAIVRARVKNHLELKSYRDQLEKMVAVRTKELSESNNKLTQKTTDLEETTLALKILLNKKDDSQKRAEEKILVSIKDSILPMLDKIKLEQLSPTQKDYLNVIESNLNSLIEPFAVNIHSKYFKLTQTEIQIATLIREGKSAQEIAELLSLKVGTVYVHRDNIRKKLGIKNKKVNLKTHLAAFQDYGPR